MLLIWGILLIFGSSKGDPCFDPYKDPKIKIALDAGVLNERPEVIDEIHRTIWEHRDQIDPRFVYYRMIGESLADPHVENPNSSAYGMFQLLGKPYGSNLTHKQILEKLYADAPGVSHRLIQVRYYLDEYVKKFIQAADQGFGCNRGKKFAAYTNIEKVAYLGWGSCNPAAIAKERDLCESVSTYKSGPCSFVKPLLENRRTLPLCATTELPAQRTSIGGSRSTP